MVTPLTLRLSSLDLSGEVLETSIRSLETPELIHIHCFVSVLALKESTGGISET